MTSKTLLYLPLVAVAAAAAGYVGGQQATGPLAISGPEDTMYVRDAEDPRGAPQAAAADLVAGDVLALAPGRHPPLRLSGLRGTEAEPIRITSADPGQPAVLEGLALRDVDHVVVEAQVVEAPEGAGAVTVTGSRNVLFRDLAVRGAPSDRTVGVEVRDSVGVTFATGSVDGFHTAFSTVSSDGVTLRGTQLSGALGPVVTAASGAWITIEDNRIDAAAARAADLPAIRLTGAAGEEEPGLTDVVVLDNWIGGAAARPARIVAAGRIRDLSIESNRLEHPAAKAIVVGAADTVSLRANVLLPRDGSPARPGIAVAPDATAVVEIANLVHDGAVAQPLPDHLGSERVHRAAAGTEAGTVATGHRVGTDRFRGEDPVGGRVLDLRGDQPVVAGTALTRPRYGWEAVELRTGETRRDLPTRLRFDAASGEAETFDPSGATTHIAALGRGTGRIGAGREGLELPKEVTEPFYDADAFVLRTRMRAVPDQTAWGQLLRIHMSMEVTVTDRGHLAIRFNTAEAPRVDLQVKSGRLLDGAWHDIEIGYDARSGELWASIDGGARESVQTWGRTRPQEFWSIHIGNPFDDRKELDGEVAMLELSALEAPAR